MKSTRTFALAVCLCLPLQLSAGPVPGTVTDPDNDAFPSDNPAPFPDLVSASVTSDGTDLHLSVRFKPGTFDQALTAAQFNLDTDQNPATGNPGTDGSCVTDAEELGVDFVLDMGADLGMDARLLGSSGCRIFTAPVMVPNAVVFVADGMDAVVPLAMLGSDDGLLNFKVALFELIEGLDGFTGYSRHHAGYEGAGGHVRAGRNERRL